MATMIVKHRVADFETWRAAFESMTATRKAHGWISHTVARDATDPNVVVIVNRMRSLDDAKRYGSSPDLKGAMAKGGVQGPPEIWFLDDAAEHAY